jgi:uncharacterized membrane protein YeaQ/YmgE (transglycosylase-associated protein family)
MPASLAASTRLMPSSALAIASIRSAARRFAACRAFRRSASGVRSSRIGSAAPIAPSRSPPFAGGSYRVTSGKSVHAVGGMISYRPRQKGHRMSIIGWIVLGLIAGFIASKLVNKQGEGLLLDIVLGIVGAVVGGFLFNQLGAAGVTGFNIYSMFVAVVGAVIVLVIYHAVAGRRVVR